MPAPGMLYEYKVLQVDSSGNAIGGTGTGAQQVQGTAAVGAAPVGNPVYVGGINNSTGFMTSFGFRNFASDGMSANELLLQSLSYMAGFNGTTEDRIRTATAAAGTTGTGLLGVGLLAFDGTNYQLLRTESATQFNLRTALFGGATGPVAAATPSDGTSAATQLYTAAFNLLFNATNHERMRSVVGAADNSSTGIQSIGGYGFNELAWDKQRNNTDATVLASAARTATPSAVTFTNYNSTYLRVVLDVTAIVDTPSITLAIDGQDAISGKWVNLLTGAAVTTVSTNTYSVGPGLPDTANVSTNKMLVRNLRVTVTHGDADSITYSAGRQLTGV